MYLYLQMKTKEELNALKKEVEALNAKLAELAEEELAEVSGGIGIRPGDEPPSWKTISQPKTSRRDFND